MPIVVLDAQDRPRRKRCATLAATHPLGGLRIVAPTLSEHDTDWLDSTDALALWRTAADLDLPVTVILYRRNNEAGRAALLGIARRFPGLAILIDHVGVPHASTPECKWPRAKAGTTRFRCRPTSASPRASPAFGDLPRVHFKITDINFDRLEDSGHDAAAFVRALTDRFGAERLLWGSDVGQSPAPYPDKIDRLRHAATRLDPDERASLFSGTALRLYGGKLAAHA